MNKAKWTEEQRAAMYKRGTILVAAGAGSGKTAVLVERVINLIMDKNNPVDIDELLVVTFTKAAASEMRERIRFALEEAVYKETEENVTERLQEQMALLDKANIMTLHSFCLNILRQYFYLINLEPDFRVGGEDETFLLKREAAQAVIEKEYEKGRADFNLLVEAFFSNYDDIFLVEQVLALYEFACSQVEPVSWLLSLPEAYSWTRGEDLLVSKWGNAYRDGLLDKLQTAELFLLTARTKIDQVKGLSPYISVFEEEINAIKKIKEALTANHWELFIKFLLSFRFNSLPRIKKQQGMENEVKFQEIKNKIISSRNKAKKIISKIQKETADWSVERQLPYLDKMKGIVKTLVELTVNFSKEYEIAKRKKNIVDFNDLEHLTLKLLKNYPYIVNNYQRRLKEILVDEYQDINSVQEEILKILSTSKNFFMVGDVKQSIYRFRMADPSLFVSKYNSFPHWEKSQDINNINNKIENDFVPDGLVIDLKQNFRSRKEILDAINFVFKQIMSKESGEIDYNTQAELICGASYMDKSDGLITVKDPVEVHLIDLSKFTVAENKLENYSSHDESTDFDGEDGGQNSEENMEELESTRVEAKLVGQRILEIIGKKDDFEEEAEFYIYDSKVKRYRPVQYSDMAILLRSAAGQISIYKEVFTELGIPHYADFDSSYFKTTEIEIILSLLQIIDNPHQDIPLAAVLRSPIVGLNGEELGRIRAGFPQGDFYEALCFAVMAYKKHRLSENTLSEINKILERYKEELNSLEALSRDILKDENSMLNKAADFLNKLIKWRWLSKQYSLEEFLWLLYRETGFLTLVGTLPGGDRRQENLKNLYQKAKQFVQTNYKGLYSFLKFIEKCRSSEKGFYNNSFNGSNENYVRIMTVHASKGLEFPVVFVPGLGKMFNESSSQGKIVLHKELGIGITVIDVENKAEYPSIIQQAVKYQIKKEAFAEEMRILYVAFTRAKEKLILIGSSKDLEKRTEQWAELSSCIEGVFPRSIVAGARSYLDWLGLALARHCDNPLQVFKDLNSWVSSPIVDESRWKIFYYNNPQVLNTIIQGQKHLDDTPEDGSEKTSELIKEINRFLNWHYPSDVNQIAKTSVTELKQKYLWSIDNHNARLIFAKTIFPRPKFLEEKYSLSRAEKGTAIHTLLQHLPLSNWRDNWKKWNYQQQLSATEQLLMNLQRKQILSEQQVESISVDSVIALLNSNLGDYMFNCDEIKREVPFVLTLFPQNAVQPVLVQGVIDVILINHKDKDRKAKIIDYKTEFISEASTLGSVLKKRYGLQMALYGLAVERLLRIKEIDYIIYALQYNKEVQLDRDFIRKQLDKLDLRKLL